MGSEIKLNILEREIALKSELMNLAKDLEAQRKAREEAEKNRELQDRLRAESITTEQQAEAQKALDFQRAQEAERMAKEAAREAAEVKFS